MENDQVIRISNEMRRLVIVPHCLIHFPFHAVESDIGQQRINHASYNVAKKVLEFELEEVIPRSRLRAAYGAGFKGAPLDGDPPREGSFPRESRASYGNHIRQTSPIVGGRQQV